MPLELQFLVWRISFTALLAFFFLFSFLSYQRWIGWSGTRFFSHPTTATTTRTDGQPLFSRNAVMVLSATSGNPLHDDPRSTEKESIVLTWMEQQPSFFFWISQRPREDTRPSHTFLELRCALLDGGLPDGSLGEDDGELHNGRLCFLCVHLLLSGSYGTHNKGNHHRFLILFLVFLFTIGRWYSVPFFSSCRFLTLVNSYYVAALFGVPDELSSRWLPAFLIFDLYSLFLSFYSTLLCISCFMLLVVLCD